MKCWPVPKSISEHWIPSRSSPLSETFTTHQEISNTFRLRHLRFILLRVDWFLFMTTGELLMLYKHSPSIKSRSLYWHLFLFYSVFIHSRCEGTLYKGFILNHSVTCHLFNLLTETNWWNTARNLLNIHFKIRWFSSYIIRTYVIHFKAKSPQSIIKSWRKEDQMTRHFLVKKMWISFS